MKKLYCLQVIDKTLPTKEWLFIRGSEKEIVQRANDIINGYFTGFHAAHDFSPQTLIFQEEEATSFAGVERAKHHLWYKNSISHENVVAGLYEKQTF